jgi:hypothetical protein
MHREEAMIEHAPAVEICVNAGISPGRSKAFAAT